MSSTHPAQTTTVEPATVDGPRTVWGLDSVQLHDCFWAARGVQVVRRGEESLIPDGRFLFLLIDGRVLTIFDSTEALRVLAKTEPEVLYVRLHETHEHAYRERVVTDERQQFVRFERLYDRPVGRLARVAFTTSAARARQWQQSTDPVNAWRSMRQSIAAQQRRTLSVEGNLYDRQDANELARFTRDLVRAWTRPDIVIRRAQRLAPGIWADPDATVDPTCRFAGPAWIGTGRKLPAQMTVIGPAVLWDDPCTRPDPSEPWKNVGPHDVANFPAEAPPDRLAAMPGDLHLGAVHRTRAYEISKRIFDVIAALIGLALSLPLYPLIMAAILIEDGLPLFFAHERETRGGRRFPCLKFRSMRRDAEKIKLELWKLNQADGPQFWMERDPRLTRVGRVLRKYRIDELPQFWNVLVGDMSLVGPRPSPHSENQYCPPWRDARLSVRPGITGLWQVNRTRRVGSDFQEWIRYDIEYVENANWQMDVNIIWRTILILLRVRQ